MDEIRIRYRLIEFCREHKIRLSKDVWTNIIYDIMNALDIDKELIIEKIINE